MAAAKTCWGCGAAFHCGPEGDAQRCWCDALPLVPPQAGLDCLCGSCLAAAASPCVKTCRLDASGTLCLGCFRTLQEIAGWQGYSAPQRLAVHETLAGRRSRYQPSRNLA